MREHSKVTEIDRRVTKTRKIATVILELIEKNYRYIVN